MRFQLLKQVEQTGGRIDLKAGEKLTTFQLLFDDEGGEIDLEGAL